MSSKTKVGLLLFGLFVLPLLGVPAFMVYRWVSSAWKASLKVAKQAGASQISEANAVRPPPPAAAKPSHLMAQAFETGILPAPLPSPAANPDEAAATLAKQIAARDENSTAALMTALQLAGFSVRGKDGSLIVKPSEAGQGMAFDAWEVAAMAKLYNDGWQLSLDDLSAVLAKCIPELRKMPFGDLFVKGVVASSQGDQPLRFWSRLVIELGRQSTGSYDLSAGNVDPHSVQLDAIQISLTLQRLYGDLRARSKPAPTPNIKASGYRDLWEQEEPRLQPAVYYPDRPVRLICASDSGPAPSGPCALSEDTLTLLDANAIYRTTEWQALVNLEHEAESGVASDFNVIMTLLKFLWTYAGLHADVTMDQAPLIRTKDLDPGDTRTLTARVWFEFDNWPMLNCLRPFLNLTGVDFGNLPNNGAADGVGVDWNLVGGGVDLSVNTQDIQKFLAAQSGAIVMFDNGPGKEGETWRNVTAKDGTTSIKVSGRPQTRDMKNLKVFPVKKEMAVAIDVKLKGADVDKFKGELVDVLGPALGTASRDWVGGLVGGLTETMFRMHWRVDKTFAFPVTDWVLCEGGWGGTITCIRTKHYVHTETGTAGETTRNANNSTDQIEVQLRGSPNADGAFPPPPSRGTLSSEVNAKDSWDFSAGGCDVSGERTDIGSGTGEVDVEFSQMGPDKYMINMVGKLLGSVEHKQVEHAVGNCGRVSPPENKSTTYSYEIYFPQFTAVADPNDPDVLRGSDTPKELQIPGTETKVSWNLRRCK